MLTQNTDTSTPKVSETTFAGLPVTGFLREKNIIGDKKANPPVPALIPVSHATFWGKIKTKEWKLTPVKLSANVTAFQVEEVRALMDSFTENIA